MVLTTCQYDAAETKARLNLPPGRVIIYCTKENPT
jgi:hypothetical protein